MGLTDKPNYEYVTKLYREMELCTEFLHCPHSEFEVLPEDDKVKLFYYREMKGKRQEYFDNKHRDRKQVQDNQIRNAYKGRSKTPELAGKVRIKK